MSKHIFIGAAWPYVNGKPHLGHIAGLIGGDILARYHRAKGDKVLYVSGSDCHGTPILVTAESMGISPREVAEKYHAVFKEVLINKLGFSYDLYTTTMTATHKRVAQDIFLKLFEKGYLVKKSEELPYCPLTKRFLPDRYIEGTCPHCGYASARGDQCDNCGNLLTPKELLDPRAKISGEKIVWRLSEHFYLRLEAFYDRLRAFAQSPGMWRGNAIQFTQNLIEEGLPERAITRDSEWGIPLPLPGYQGKCLYVWFDAVCGYLSASQQLAEDAGTPDAWRAWWDSKSSTYHYYIHGKDNVPFHTIIWPAMLMGSGELHLPDAIVSSELLTLEGAQFSKSRGWAVWADDMLEKYNADFVRHYLVVSGPETADADFTWKEFQTRVNNDLVGAWGNLVHRVQAMSEKISPSLVPTHYSDEFSEQRMSRVSLFEKIAESIEKLRFREAEKRALEKVYEMNQFINAHEPWKLSKNNPEKANAVLSECWGAIIDCARVLYPFIPFSSEKILNAFEMPPVWESCGDIRGHSRKILSPLFTPISDEQIQKEIDVLSSNKK